MHLGSILTNDKFRVGRDCSIHINTALVAHGVTGGVPRLGDNIVIGTGAILLGDICISDNVAIGANLLVNKTFKESNIVIVGVPAKTISSNGTIEWNKEN